MTRNSHQSEDRHLPLVTISVVSHGNSKEVLRLLKSVSLFERVNSIQVIITDNLGKEFPEIGDSPWFALTVLRNQHRMGFASNHNRAFQLARGKYFCVLNPDVLFEQGIFSSLIRWLESGCADIASPLIVDKYSMPQDSFRNFPTPFEIITRRLPGYRFIPPVANDAGLIMPDWIAGTFMLMKSETFRAIHGFDEKYYLYFEDVDLCARAQLAGLKLVVDTSIRVQHDAQRASRKKLKYLLWHVQSAALFFASPVYKKVRYRSK